MSPVLQLAVLDIVLPFLFVITSNLTDSTGRCSSTSRIQETTERSGGQRFFSFSFGDIEDALVFHRSTLVLTYTLCREPTSLKKSR